MKDSIYNKLQRKRTELDQMTGDLGRKAASLRDHEAMVKEAKE